MASRSQGLLIGCLLFISAFAVVAILIAFLFGFSTTFPALGSDRVGLIKIEGPISNVDAWIDEIEANRTDNSVGAVVLRINSPGGEVAPSQELYNAVTRLQQSKPVVASFGSVAASGGYYAAVPADTILANPGTLTGSIGVIFSFPTARELLEKIGLRYEVYKSGDLKDIGSFSRRPSEQDDAVFDALVADVYDQFVEAVMEGRGMTRSEVLPLADGRIFSGRQAVEVGLVDGLGDLHQAILTAASMAGISGEPRVVRKARPLAPIWFLLDDLMRGQLGPLTGPALQYRSR